MENILLHKQCLEQGKKIFNNGPCPLDKHLRIKISTVSLYITESCNLKCDFCYENPDRIYEGHTNTSIRSSRMMDTSTIDEIMAWIEKSEQFEPIEKIHLSFFGGEPTLPKAWELVRYTISKWPNMKEYGLATNGVLLTDEMVEVINKYRIQVSLGLKRGKYRGIDEIKYGILHYPNMDVLSKIKLLYINVHMEEWYYRAADEFRQLANKCPHARINFALPVPEPWDRYDESILKDQMYQIYKYTFDKNPYQQSYTRLFLQKLVNPIRHLQQLTSCGAGYSMCAITPDKRVFPCVGLRNFGEEYFSLCNVGEKIPEPQAIVCCNILCRPKCHNCEYILYCLRYCPAVNYAYNGKLNDISDKLCKRTKMETSLIMQAWNDLTPERRRILYDKEVKRSGNQNQTSGV